MKKETFATTESCAWWVCVSQARLRSLSFSLSLYHIHSLARAEASLFDCIYIVRYCCVLYRMRDTNESANNVCIYVLEYIVSCVRRAFNFIL